MSDITNYKKLSLFIILDAYVTKNAIEHFFSQDHTEFKQSLISNAKNKDKIKNKIDIYVDELSQELTDINEFLGDEENTHWQILGLNKEFFDRELPRYKRKIEWFRSVDRYAFDYRVFFSNSYSQNIYN